MVLSDINIQELNDEQQKAVSNPADTTLVLAGAGSGKTRVLTERIIWLLSNDKIDPREIFAVTFTNKAANEMRFRLQSKLHIAINNLWVGTFHSLALRLLRIHWQAAGLCQNFQVIDSDDQLRLIKRLMKTLNIAEKVLNAKKIQYYINNNKDEGLRAINIAPQIHEKIMHDFYTTYEKKTKQLGLVDFSEILLSAHFLWFNNHDILEHYRQRFRYILVDEFQDTNSLQYAWLRLLSGKNNCLMAVGDDDQSIYGWRGAKIENILQFQQDFPQSEIIRLERNYRSTGNILKAANYVIQNNSARLGKTLWNNHGDGDKIFLYSAYDEVDEANCIVNEIINRQDKLSYSDMVVLYRSNVQSRALEESMLLHNIPYRIYGGQRFFARAEIKHALAYLRLSRYRDDSSFERIINFPPRGLGEKTLQSIRSYANHQNCELWQAATNLLQMQSLTPRASKSLYSFMQLIEHLSHESRQRSLVDFSAYVIEKSGLLEWYEKEPKEQSKMRIENLQELVTACQQFNADNYNIDEVKADNLELFLMHIALDNDENRQDENQVQMMTLHAAKGLEFPLVFMSGMEEGLFPSMLSTEEGRLDEERRLCYVGITRAQKHLYLTYAKKRTRYGIDYYQKKSRFLHEIPEKILQKI